MSKSRFEYVKQFEQQTDTLLLPNCFLVVRVDGRAFHRFAAAHKYRRPNDERGIGLMNRCAERVMREFPDIFVAYGESDEYSFVFRRNTTLYSRRQFKYLSYVVSLFSSSFVYHWKEFFGDEELQYAPCFDARVVCYPTLRNMRDYLSWRQADTHINNLYNTCFWALVQQDNKTPTEAEQILRVTDSGAKNEMLFTQFKTNYNELPAVYRKGSVLVWERTEEGASVVTLHEDIIGNGFWDARPELLKGQQD
eukprot:m51a1_g9563 putative probable trna guanylyltransferase (251) ;mRNA; f:907307-908330